MRDILNASRKVVFMVFYVGLSASLTVSKPDTLETLFRTRRGIKDALPKEDEFSQSRAILQMRQKMFTLENSMTSVNKEVEKMSEQNKDLHEEIDGLKEYLDKLDKKFEIIKDALSHHSNKLGDLENIVSPDDNLYVLSNQTCGGVLVGQSGYIVFSNAALRGSRYPSSCIWTIRANNREKIKISTQGFQFSMITYQSPYRTISYSLRPYAYILEVIANDNKSANVTQLFQTKITPLQRNMHHVFAGPLLFVVYPLGPQTSDDYSDIDLRLQFDGIGKLVQKNTFFSHETVYNTSGEFNHTQLQRRTGSVDSDNVTYSQDYTSIVVSNFSTKVHLQVILNSEGCALNDSFIVITELLTDAELTDCCKIDCKGRNSLVNYDSPFVILITKKYLAPLNFSLNWIAEPPYPSSSRPEGSSLYGHKCGEVLGGVSGSVLYKPHISYRNSERCIWVIVPQPRPRSAIMVSVGTNGVENIYDHLYMMELTDINGTALADGPKITRMGRYGSYEAYSREVYIVFYSDSSVTGYGFSLSWRAIGDVVKTGNDVTKLFTILKHDTGMAQSREMNPLLTNGVYEVFILTPIIPYSYVFGMQLHINQTSPVSGPHDCIQQDIQVYTSLDGLLAKADIHCNNPGETIFENADGLAMIVLDNHDATSNVAMDFFWRQEYGEGNDSYVVVENNQCGGVIKGSKGVIKYKISFDYLNNERCVWILHSPNSTSITLKLFKDGFEPCCDHIMVNTIEPLNGTLRNDTVQINRLNRTRTFEESVLVIVFRSDGSTRGRGFALQFTGNGQVESPSPYRYQIRHHNEPFGAVAYPSSEWEDEIPGVQDIFLIASSIKIGADEDPLIMPSNISWAGGTFADSLGNCSYDSITFYTTPEPEGWKQRERFPRINDTLSCPSSITVPKHEDLFSTVFSAYIAVYKPIHAEVKNESNLTAGLSNMAFTFEKSAGCGGVIIRESGDIRYKEDGRYSNLEKCVWLVHAPQADKIRFWLERSGFEECCDVLKISTIDRTLGIPHAASVISQFNRTAVVDGPVAIVTFTSDSSVVGEGFRLSFSTETQTTTEFPNRYHLEHRNQPRNNSFLYQVESNEIVIVVYNPEIHRQSYDGAGRTTVSIASLRPQINDQCQSDTLTLYDVFGRDKGIVEAKSYAAIDVVRNTFTDKDIEGNCTQLNDSNFHPCEDDIRDCGDAPESNIFQSNTTSFLAVYRSVNVTSNELTHRGFVMASATTFPALHSVI